jgi:hypothetical protein
VSATTRLALWVLDELLPRTRFARTLEVYMSLTNDALVELDDATNEVAGELEALVAQVAGMDGDTAARINAAATRLRGLAADPENPVPVG